MQATTGQPSGSLSLLVLWGRDDDARTIIIPAFRSAILPPDWS